MDRHPVQGAKILGKLPGDMPPLLPVIAYQHHMATDGSGYPVRSPGQKPHPASLLVSVADVFDALRTVRPYRPAMTTGQAFSMLLSDARRGRIMRQLLAPLAGLLGVTSTGSLVTLSNGKEATVVEEHPDNPLTPVVEDKNGQTLDLSSETSVSLTGTLEPPPPPAEA